MKTVWQGLCAMLALGLVLLAQPVAAQVRIAVIGDSNVAGKGVSSSDNYPTQLEQRLRAKGYNVSVSNSGQNGDTTGGLLARLDSAAPAGTQVAVVWIGINDRKRMGANTAQIQAGRAAIAKRLRTRSIEVVMLASASFQSLHRNPALSLPDHHLNRTGYAQVVARTIGQVEAAIASTRNQS